MVELDVIRRGSAGDKANGFPHDEGNGFGLGFADGLEGASVGILVEVTLPG